MIAIIMKELRTYFSQMTGYIFLALTILLMALFFVLMNVFTLNPNYHQVLGTTTIFFFVLIPTLTMRLFADEVKNRTDQLLYTSPITVPQIVMGKYLAACLLFVGAMAVTMLFPLMLSRYGELPVGQIAGAYVGFILMGLCFIAVGLFISVLTDNQIIAAVGTFGVLFLFTVIDLITAVMPVDTTSSLAFVGVLIFAVAALLYNGTKNIIAAGILALVGIVTAFVLYFINNLIFEGFIVRFLQWLSVHARYNNFIGGVLNLADVVYYVTFGLLFLYLAINVIEKRRWR